MADIVRRKTVREDLKSLQESDFMHEFSADVCKEEKMLMHDPPLMKITVVDMNGMAEKEACSICNDRVADVLNRCRHLATCIECYTRIQTQAIYIIKRTVKERKPSTAASEEFERSAMLTKCPMCNADLELPSVRDMYMYMTRLRSANMLDEMFPDPQEEEEKKEEPEEEHAAVDE